MNRITSNRYAILTIGVITMLAYGIIYAWSVFIPPLEAEFGWDRSSTSLVFSIAMIGLSLGMSSVGQLSKHMPLRRVFLLGGFFVVCGLTCCQFINMPWQLYLMYGVVCGYGVGLAYTSWTTSVLAWFGDKAGFASGILVMGFGMGGMVLGALATALIYSPIGWRWAFAIIGILVFAWSLIATPFMKNPPEEIANLKPKHDDTGLNLNGSETVKEPSFWIFCMWRSFLMGSVAAIIAQASVMMTGIGASIAFATAAVGALSLGNGLGRPLGGIVYDKIGQSRTLILLPMLGLISSLMMLPCYLLRSPVLFAIFILFEGLVYGMYSAINTSYMRITYGQKHLAVNTGISALVLAPFNLIFPFIAACVYESTGGYAVYFMLVPFCSAISLFCGIIDKSAIANMEQRRK